MSMMLMLMLNAGHDYDSAMSAEEGDGGRAPPRWWQLLAV